MKTFIVSTPDQELWLENSGEYKVVLEKPNASVSIVGAFQAVNKDNQEVSVIIHHRAPHTRATTTLKGVARDQSQLKFLGKIIIDEQCGDTNSFLTERILLLSDQAKAEAIPELEILSDDVKCSHAASVSSVPKEHLFYLQSRGLSRRQAEEMLIEGFLDVGRS